MPKRDTETPVFIRGYAFHGLSLEQDGDNATGRCVFCDREDKFSVKVETGEYRCLVCDEVGNLYTFMREVWQSSYEATNDYSELVEMKGIREATLQRWEVCKSIMTGHWLLPGFNSEGKMTQLYRYSKFESGWRLLPTPVMRKQDDPKAQYEGNIRHQLHYCKGTYNPEKEIVALCEGPWDAMRLWEVLRETIDSESGLIETANEANSMLSAVNVIGVPGATIFNEAWTGMFKDKVLNLFYDNDHPRKNPKTGKLVPPAGLTGMKKVSATTSGSSVPPAEVNYIKWGKDDYAPDLPHSYDVRDYLNDPKWGETDQFRLGSLLDRLTPVPEDWLKESKKGNKKEIELLPCDSWKELDQAWREAMRWEEGLSCALSVMLASIASVKAVGDQLWIKVIGPASCGKSTLCEAVSTNSRYVIAKSTIRGFHSGQRTRDDSGGDAALIAQLYDKTLVTKDGDTLLQAPNLSQILAEARDIYDSVSRTHYRNAMSKDYTGVRMTWLLCGTSSLRSIDSSELGERFLDCVIMEGIDDDFEDSVGLDVARQTKVNMSMETNGDLATHHNPQRLRAMALTGGYINHLRANANELLNEVVQPEWVSMRCARLGKFIAYMRARPSSRQKEIVEREFSARLIIQCVRLANCLAIVMNRKQIDKRVMRRVEKVAFDTSRGNTYNISRHLYHSGDQGSELKAICLATNLDEVEARALLKFLRGIGVVENYQPSSHHVKRKMRYRLTARLMRLFSEVMPD